MTVTIVIDVGAHVHVTQEELKPHLVDWNIALMPDGSVLKLVMQAEAPTIPSIWKRIK